MNLKKVHHIAIIGSNYEQSRHFYVDLLGFSVIRENYRPERDDYKIDLQLDGMELELFIIKDCPKRPSYPEAYGLRHLAFAVDSVDDTVRELNKKGILTEPIRVDAYTGKKMTFFSDPDNLPLEIHEYSQTVKKLHSCLTACVGAAIGRPRGMTCPKEE